MQLVATGIPSPNSQGEGGKVAVPPEECSVIDTDGGFRVVFLGVGVGKGGVGGLRIRSMDLEISSVLIKLTHTHTHPYSCMHACTPTPYAPLAEKQSDCPEARSEMSLLSRLPPSLGWGTSRRLQKDLVTAKSISFGIRLI